MQTVLTGWKDIAQYVRKGVRTIQRWEREFGFPVRRVSNGTHQTVLAVREEIDVWVHGKSARKKSRELEQCENEVMRLKEEVRRLKGEVARLEGTK